MSTIIIDLSSVYIYFSLQELLRLKDTQIEDLRYEAARLRKAHDDLLATYEAKLAKLGVPSEELGFKYVLNLTHLYSSIPLNF